MFNCFYIPISVEDWVMNSVRVVKVFFPVGKFIILYILLFSGYLHTHSKIIIVVLAKLNSIKLYYVHRLHMYMYTHPHPTLTQHTYMHENREGKPPLNLVIVLLHDIWMFCWKPSQNLPSTGTPIGRGIPKTAAGHDSLI